MYFSKKEGGEGMKSDAFNGVVYCVLIPGVAAGVLAGLLIHYILTPSHPTPATIQKPIQTIEVIMGSLTNYVPIVEHFSHLKITVVAPDKVFGSNEVVVGRKVEKEGKP